MKVKKVFGFTRSAFIALIIIFLSGCGGGSSDETVQNSDPEGLWVGVTNNNQYITGLVLDDGIFYMLYSVVGDPSKIAGIVQGGLSISGSSFSSSDAKDFNLMGAGVLPATLVGTVVTKEALNGSITYMDGSSSSFTSSYSHEYDMSPSLLDLAGSYTGTVAFSLGFEDVTVNIASDGKFSGAGASGCKFSGVISPRDSGNVFNGSILFGGYPCYFENKTLSGIVYYNVSENLLYVAAPTQDRNEGILFVGSKP